VIRDFLGKQDKLGDRPKQKKTKATDLLLCQMTSQTVVGCGQNKGVVGRQLKGKQVAHDV